MSISKAKSVSIFCVYYLEVMSTIHFQVSPSSVDKGENGVELYSLHESWP